MRSRRLRTLFAIILLLLAVPAALVLAEFALRAADWAPLRNPQLEPFAISLHEGLHRVSQIPDLYWELARIRRDKFQGVMVTTNRRGFRARDYGPRTDAVRIVVLGDSITFGAAVEQDQAYPQVLERLLNRRRKAEVVNCGVSGYNFIQYAVNYEHKARRYDPDLVIVGLFEDDFEPPYVPREQSVWLWLELHSRLYRLLGARWRATAPRLFGDQRFYVNEATAAGMTRLAGFIDEVRGERRSLLFVLHPGLDDRELPEKNAVMLDAKSLLDQHGAPYIDLWKVYRAHGSLSQFSTNAPFANPHPNAVGHALIAEAIDDFLLAHPELLARRPER